MMNKVGKLAGVVVLIGLGAVLMGAIPECYSDAEFRRAFMGETQTAHPQYTPQWSRDGSLIVFGHEDSVFVVDSDGSSLQGPISGKETGRADRDYSPSISASGSEIVYTTLRYKTGLAWAAKRGFEIASYSIEDSKHRRLTENDDMDTNPSWSPDGSMIAFASDRDGSSRLYTMKADGSDVKRIHGLDFSSLLPPQWSPDGSYIVFPAGDRSDNRIHVYKVRADGSNLVQVSPDWADLVRWSPDGARLALAKVEDGRVKIDVMNADGSDPRRVLDVAPETDWGVTSRAR